ncbi:MAG: addiction module protein [Opitutae bacterium]|nr:addiction module protein [Opitutae bacterium]
MNITLPLDKMTVEEKLRLMEEIWADLSRNPDDIPIPEWHLEILREREQLVKEGKEHYIDWEVAKRQIDEAIARGRPNESRDS